MVIFTDGEDTTALIEGRGSTTSSRARSHNKVPLYFVRTNYDKESRRAHSRQGVEGIGRADRRTVLRRAATNPACSRRSTTSIASPAAPSACTRYTSQQPQFAVVRARRGRVLGNSRQGSRSVSPASNIAMTSRSMTTAARVTCWPRCCIGAGGDRCGRRQDSPTRLAARHEQIATFRDSAPDDITARAVDSADRRRAIDSGSVHEASTLDYWHRRYDALTTTATSRERDDSASQLIAANAAFRQAAA